MAANDVLNNTNDSPSNPNGAGKFESDRFTNSPYASNTGTDWNYVYDLSGDRKYSTGTGQLKSNFGSNQVLTSSNLHGNISRTNQAVMLLDNYNDTKLGSESNWNLYNNSISYTKNNINYGKLSFSFNVTGTHLATANQIAFRWAMTCANDIIECLADFSNKNRPDIAAVSEPNTIVLMLLTMAGLIYRKNPMSN